ncbi:glycosyltransferase family 2 protein [Sediminicoccus rosea]|uniref:Glycosyltransferase family 2 protein n=1 Tax=Sediminicoccus rosea TaxID=1225128 RepID=A0ABZ0PLB5_9PROT|nr:glycosyltransferase family 2 protein [Sediminicoccus rosea]WPB86432.1 glycosyltransferase family 2 protein [Sediminicoccus rosea]
MTAPAGLRVGVIIPTRNEALALPSVLPAIPPWVAEVIVVDNASNDGTPEIARRYGARVVSEPRRGYGRACLAGIAALSPDVDTVIFMDGDASDRPEDMLRLLAPIAAGEAELVIGARTLGVETGALTPQQRFGNALACLLIRLVWGVRYTDLGPFRVIRREALARLAMRDETWGWTVEMQVRAARLGLRVQELPVGYRRRIGISKISGTLSGTIRAGWKIIWVIGAEALDGLRARRRS